MSLLFLELGHFGRVSILDLKQGIGTLKVRRQMVLFLKSFLE
jgi:hypothetical protein